MLATLDLTSRQLARVLEQAARTQCKIGIEPRPGSSEVALTGCVERREDQLLLIALHDTGVDRSLMTLTGAFCDVKMSLSGQLYLFTTCIVDALENSIPQRLLLAAPEVIQVVNRRKFARKQVSAPVTVSLWPQNANKPVQGELRNIGVHGLGCQIDGEEPDNLLFIGDPVRVQFRLQPRPEVFDLTAVICSKNPTGKPDQRIVGLEFCLEGRQAPPRETLEHLYAVLCEEMLSLDETDGDL